MGLPAPLSLASAARAMREGELSAHDLVRQCLETIALCEPAIGAWASLAPDDALARARAIDAIDVNDVPRHVEPNAPLRGIPIGVKDIIDVQGMITGCNSPISANRVAQQDATIVARARAAGAVVLGKTTTQEFATRGNMPATRNPHSPLHTPGGSSSGSAASVAAGMVPAALSTQTAGSIVRPASYCGIVGFKPTFGWMPLDGVKTIAPTLDTLGLHARTVTDAALTFAALCGGDGVCQPGARLNSNLGGASQALLADDGAFNIDALIGQSLCAGIVRDPFWALAEPATAQALELAAQRLRVAGFRVIDLALPAGFERLGQALDTISDAEACVSLAEEWARHRAQLSPGVQKKIARGLAIPAGQAEAAYALAEQCNQRRAQLFDGCDFVLTPSSPGYAPLLSAGDPGDSSFSKLWTILGTPSVSIPVPLPGPLPIGLEVICDAGKDFVALQTARAIEAIFTQRAQPQ